MVQLNSNLTLAVHACAVLIKLYSEFHVCQPQVHTHDFDE